MKIGLNLSWIDLPLGFDFTNWALNHVILCICNFFPGMRPSGLNLMLWKLNLSLGFKSGNSWFWTHARAGWLALEREIRAPSILHCFGVRSSGVIDARAWPCVLRSGGCRAPNRAWFSPIQHFWLFCSTLEYLSLRSSRNLCLHVRSSGTPVFWKF